MTSVASGADAAPQPESEADQPCPHIDASAVVRRSEQVYWEAFDDGAVLLDERTGALHTLNATAGLLWQCLDGTAPLGDVVADFADVYGSPQVAGDLEAAARALCRQGLLEHRVGDGDWWARHEPGQTDDLNPDLRETPVHDDSPVELDPSLTPDLSRQSWTHHTARFQALAFDFTVRTTDAAIGRYLDEVLGAMVMPGQTTAATHLYSVLPKYDRYLVFLGDEPVSWSKYLGLALRHLMWDVNRRAVRSMPERIVLHASAAARSGAALLFPASRGSGKTTLVAGLVQAGLDYLTDEAVAVDTRSLHIVPYAKPLAIESREILARVRPRSQEHDLPGLSEFQWYVPPEAIRPDAVADVCTPWFVIFPKYQEGARTRLVPVDRSEATRLMANESFNFHQLGAEGLAALAAVARRAETYRLTVGSLDEACGQVLSLVD